MEGKGEKYGFDIIGHNPQILCHRCSWILSKANSSLVLGTMDRRLMIATWRTTIIMSHLQRIAKG
jgi:hypothetical protein